MEAEWIIALIVVGMLVIFWGGYYLGFGRGERYALQHPQDLDALRERWVRLSQEQVMREELRRRNDRWLS